MSEKRFALDLRDERVGGDLTTQHVEAAAQDLVGHNQLLLLIHGFNVNRTDADEGYETLLARLREATAPGRDWLNGRTPVRVYWPGDANWGVLKPLVYPRAVAVAEHAGALLADFLDRLHMERGGQLDIDVLVHSLGTRVLLEAAQRLNAARIRHALLMASAVPTWRLERQGDGLRRGLQHLRGPFGNKTLSIHSAGDWVLAYSFPLGETLRFGQEGVLPVALGHEHWAGATAPNAPEQAARDALGHGSYWEEVPADDVLGTLASTDTALARALPDRSINAREAEARVHEWRDLDLRTFGA